MWSPSLSSLPISSRPKMRLHAHSVRHVATASLIQLRLHPRVGRWRSSSERRFFLDRDSKMKRRSTIELGVERDRSAVVLDDHRADQGQALPGSFANRLRGEELVENEIANMRRNAATRIADRDDRMGR